MTMDSPELEESLNSLVWCDLPNEVEIPDVDGPVRAGGHADHVEEVHVRGPHGVDGLAALPTVHGPFLPGAHRERGQTGEGVEFQPIAVALL